MAGVYRNSTTRALHDRVNSRSSEHQQGTDWRDDPDDVEVLLQAEVLELTAAGKPDKAIALALDLSLRTIQLRRASVMRKMQVGSRAELIGLAHRLDRVPTVG